MVSVESECTAEGGPMPALALYGSTERQTFPLILVFGREFNNNEPIARPYRMGSYCLCPGCAPGASFWNCSYSWAGRTARFDDLKAIVRKHDSSPIVFSNALPNPIPNGEGRKQELRGQIPLDEIRNYLQWIFESGIIARVKCITMSGLTDAPFKAARDFIDQKCAEQEIHTIRVPYFVRESIEKIDSGIQGNDREVLNEILLEFRKNVPG